MSERLSFRGSERMPNWGERWKNRIADLEAENARLQRQLAEATAPNEEWLNVEAWLDNEVRGPARAAINMTTDEVREKDG